MPLISEQPYGPDAVPDYPQSTTRKLRIIHVGAGAAGLLFAYKTRKLLQNFELAIYEKNHAMGGTWYENRYPGCACDIPAHSYTFSFEGNPEWSGFYSYSNEIQDYMLSFAKKYRAEEFVTLNTEVTGATWIEETGKWRVDLKGKDGRTFTDECDILVNGSGVVNKWKWPAIEGLHDFKGVLAHSANWDGDLNWAGKKVAVIGTGSSSIQMVPRFAATAERLYVFMRNKTYIGPQIATSVSNKDADPDAMDPGAAGKHAYTEKEKERFRSDPEYHLKYRQDLERSLLNGFPAFFRGSELNIEAKKSMQQSMAKRLGDRDDLKQALIPDWSPGCRRLTPGEGYLEALIRDNVTTVQGEIIKITAEGIVTADGNEHKVDILACATGFNVQYLPHFTITGQQGQVMQDQVEPNIYASISAPGFPNYFVVNGPRGNWGQGCALPSHEVQIEYILQCAKKMQEDGIHYMVPKQLITTQLNLYMDAWHRKNSVWAEDCRSWYKARLVKHHEVLSLVD